ncbi:MAG: hypothetical protein ACJ75J_14055 [Cytophagaceae bacterium]
MKPRIDMPAMIFFKEGSKAISEFGFYMFGCIKGSAVMDVPEDLFGKTKVEVFKFVNEAGQDYNIPVDYIARIKYLKNSFVIK